VTGVKSLSVWMVAVVLLLSAPSGFGDRVEAVFGPD
jgi:hypothetical protein